MKTNESTMRLVSFCILLCHVGFLADFQYDVCFVLTSIYEKVSYGAGGSRWPVRTWVPLTLGVNFLWQ